MNAVVLAPWCGLFVPAIVASVLAIAFGLWSPLDQSDAIQSNTIGGVNTTDSTGNMLLIRAGMAFLIGGILACQMRLINQLMPHRRKPHQSRKA